MSPADLTQVPVSLGQVRRFGLAARRAERADMGRYNAPPPAAPRGPFPTGPALFVIEVTGPVETTSFGAKGLYPAAARAAEFKYSSADPAEHGLFWDDDPDVEPCWAAPFEGGTLAEGDVGVGFCVEEYRAAEGEPALPIFVVVVPAASLGFFTAQIVGTDGAAEPNTIYDFRRVRRPSTGWEFVGAAVTGALRRLPVKEPSPTAGARPPLTASTTLLAGDVVLCWENPDHAGAYLCVGEARKNVQVTQFDPATCTSTTYNLTGAGLVKAVA